MLNEVNKQPWSPETAQNKLAEDLRSQSQIGGQANRAASDAPSLTAEISRKHLIAQLEDARSYAAHRFRVLDELYNLVRNAPAEYAEFHMKIIDGGI
jgi:hypothetical protein